jgi:TolB-like protein/Tfp pilus assembly protein PilF
MALYLAWNYEHSPQGFVSTTSEASWQNPLKGSQRKPLTGNWIITLMLVISLGIFFFSRQQRDFSHRDESEASELTIPDLSVAVLPLTSMTPDEESRAFSDGQWEAILSQLSKIEDLRVISRQSTEQYRVSTKSATDIAEELRVTHLVEGSVQKYGDQVRVTVQLIEAKDDRHLWAEEFTSNIENIFALHTQIATAVATQLELTLNKPVKRFQQNLSLDPDVYDIYLSGVHLLNRFHRSNRSDSNFNEQGLNQLGRVVKEESAFADAFVHLGRAFMNRRYYGYGEQFSDTAVALVEKALELDPDNFEAHKYLGIFHLFYSTGEAEEGVVHLQKALEINANDREVLAELAKYYLEQAQFEKAIPLVRKSFRNTPTLQGDGFITRIEYLNIIGTAYRSMGMYQEAMKVEEQSMAIDPNHPSFRVAFLLTMMGKHNEALPYFQEEYLTDTTNFRRIAQMAEAYGRAKQWERAEHFYRIAFKIWESQSPTPDNSFILFRFGHTLWEQGKQDEATEMFELHKKLVREFMDSGNRFPGLRYDLACNYAYNGNTEEALNLLKDMPFWWVTYGLTRIDPMLDPIRKHPEFVEILQKQRKEMLEMREVLNMDKFHGDLEWVLYR